jgi:hypothetical protein
MADDRMQPLRECLADLHAIQLASHAMKDVDGNHIGRLDLYSINGRVLIVQVHYQRRLNQLKAVKMVAEGTEPLSWDLYRPVTDDGKIDVTLQALRLWAKTPTDLDELAPRITQRAPSKA